MTVVERRELARWRPFCSVHCRLIDLHHWFSGTYRISDPLTPDADWEPTIPDDPDETRQGPAGED